MSSIVLKHQRGYDAYHNREVHIQMYWSKAMGYRVDTRHPARDGLWSQCYRSRRYSKQDERNFLHCYRRQCKLHPMIEAQHLALAYGTVLRSWLTAEQIAAIETNPDDSPDNYCDSNMAMDMAFIVVTGRLYSFWNGDLDDELGNRGTEEQNEIDDNLINHAHGLAASYGYEGQEKPIMVSVAKGEPVTIYDYLWSISGELVRDPDEHDLALVNAIKHTCWG